MKILNEIRCIELSIHLWTARKKLRPQDLKNITTDDIPPEKLASLGSKLICSPKEIAVFSKLKKRATRICEISGTRFLGGYAVPKNKVDSLLAELKDVESEFNKAKSNFLANYQVIIDQWINENSEWKHIIKKAVTPKDEVEKKLGFDYRVFCVSEHVSDTDQSTHNDGFKSHVGSLSDTLFKEVAQEANSTWEKSFRGKKSLTRNIFRPIKTLRDKLDGLSFIDPLIFPVIERIDDCLAGMPKQGPINGANLSALESLFFLMASAKKMKEHGQSSIDLASNTETTKVTIYCPRGCNSLDVPVDDATSECAACGSVMSAESLDDFDNATDETVLVSPIECDTDSQELEFNEQEVIPATVNNKQVPFF